MRILLDSLLQGQTNGKYSATAHALWQQRTCLTAVNSIHPLREPTYLHTYIYQLRYVIYSTYIYIFIMPYNLKGWVIEFLERNVDVIICDQCNTQWLHTFKMQSLMLHISQRAKPPHYHWLVDIIILIPS